MSAGFGGAWGRAWGGGYGAPVEPTPPPAVFQRAGAGPTEASLSKTRTTMHLSPTATSVIITKPGRTRVA